MKPLSALSPREARGLAGLLFDLDDTLLDRGKLTERAYAALHRLAGAGLRLVVVTGRPAGWAEVLVRMWPIDAAVAENGAVGLALDRRDQVSLRRHEEVDEAGRRARRVRLASAYETLRREFAEARLTDDIDARRSDLALDIGERQRVAPERIAAMVQAARKMGLRTFVSSVHLHLTLDSHDKASGSIALLANELGEDPTVARFRYAYVGDSENDAAPFAAFEVTFGVANVRERIGRMSVPPRFVASSERGAGFAEIADRLLELRGPAPSSGKG